MAEKRPQTMTPILLFGGTNDLNGLALCRKYQLTSSRKRKKHHKATKPIFSHDAYARSSSESRERLQKKKKNNAIVCPCRRRPGPGGRRHYHRPIVGLYPHSTILNSITFGRLSKPCRRPSHVDFDIRYRTSTTLWRPATGPQEALQDPHSLPRV